MTPPLPRFHKLDPDKRARMLQAACREFCAHGYEAASLNRIIEQMGISKGSLYYYFEDKLDVFVTVLEGLAHPGELTAHSGVLEAQTPQAFWGAMEGFIERGALMIKAHPELVGMGRAFRALSPQAMASARVQDYTAQVTQQFASIIEHGQRLETIRRDIPSDILMGMWSSMSAAMDQWALSALVEGDMQQARHIWRVSLELFQRVFAHPEVS